ncbi:MAG: hypothetical protein KBT34_02625 [Prevotella sp.]|nr:hypothetical protein [Candidatus Prevotella equi]
MNRPIIALKEMINISETTPQFNASLKSRAACTARHILLALLLLTTGATSAWAQEPPVFDKWDGKVPAVPANTNVATVNAAGITGDGTMGSPFLIKNANDFAFFWTASYNGKISSSTQYWRLDANIDLDNKSWATYIEKNGTFKGKFDGNGKIIKNMNLAPSKANLNYGLFCQVEGQAANNRAEVKNLTIDHATIEPTVDLAGNTSVGFVVGKTNKYADIVNVKVTNSTITYAKNINGNQYVGGVVGQTNTDTKVQDCKVTTLGITAKGTTTNAYFGGLIGHINNQTTVTNCSTSDVSVTYDLIANASRISGLVGYSQSTTADTQTTIKGCSVSGTDIQLKAGINNGSYIGALLGQGGKSTVLGDGTEANKNTVSSPVINIAGDIKAVSYIGGAIGDFAGASSFTSEVKKLTVTSPSITTNNYTVANSLIGGVFGRINTFITVDGVNLTGTNLTTTNVAIAQQIGTFAGQINGSSAQEVSLKNVAIDKSDLTFGSSNTSNTVGIRTGVIGQVGSNVSFNTWTISGISKITVNGNLATTGSRLGGFVGNVEPSDGIGNKVSFKTIKINGATTINVTGDITAGSHIGGFVGHGIGRSKDNTTVTMDDVTIKTPAITVSGAIKAGSYVGGFAGHIATACKLKNCKVTTSSTITVGEINTVTSYVGGAIANIQGAANYPTSIDGLTVPSPSVTINTIAWQDCYVGGVFGRINTYCDVIKTITASNPTVICKSTGNLNKALNIGSFAGGIFGVAAQKLDMTDVTVTGNSALTIGEVANKETTTVSSVKAGFIGRSETNVNLDNWNIANSAITINGSLTSGGCQIGGFSGYLAPQDKLADAKFTTNNITLSASTINVTGGITVGSYLGGFAGYIQGRAYTGSLNTTSKITLSTSSITVGGKVTAGSYFGGFAGNVNTGCALDDCKITTSATLTLNGGISATSYIGGAFGNFVGAAGFTSTATGINITKPTITLGGDAAATTLYVGGLAGYQNLATLKNSAASSGDITLNISNTSNKYIGGAVGYMKATATEFSTLEKVQVLNGKIHTGSNLTFAKDSKALAVGGLVGYMEQNATTFTDVHNCIVDGNDINLSGYKPESANTSGNLYNHQKHTFVVGGVIGRINTPSRLPKDLYYSGKIYAPFAAVGPIVGIFHTNQGAAAYAYDDYTGSNAAALTPAEWEKAKTWYYTGYKIGLTDNVRTQTTRTRNYTASTSLDNSVNYLTITPSVLIDNNKVAGAVKPSKTVLAYTASGGTDVDKTLFPAWTTNSTTYPEYYMYYMQGINRGIYVPDANAEAVKTIVLNGSTATMTLSPSTTRGFVKNFTVTPSEALDSYEWYVNGVKSAETTATASIALSINDITGSIKDITVIGKKGGSVAAIATGNVGSIVLRVKDSSQDISTFGTKLNPYLLGGATGADELQLLSHLSTLDANVEWEGTLTSVNHYNKAYYEMDGDIDMSGVANFTPISFPKSNDTKGSIAGYHQNFIFSGVFDGKGHKISGLKENWYAGALNSNYNMGWGLFSAVGSPAATGTTIKNLVIDGAVLTHKTDNTSFYYNNGTSGNGNFCMVGVLAGIVGSNTTIQNIQISNSQITDAGTTSDYNLATKGLYVGGAVGSVQYDFQSTTNAPIAVDIQHIAAQVDITLTKPQFAYEATAAAVNVSEASQFNVGGIVGRYIATGATQEQMQSIMPKYTLFSGTVNARKAWISPVVAALRYASQQGNDWKNYSKQWEGNNAAAGSQITITNAQYYDFKIQDGTTVTEITDAVPENTCGYGFRTMTAHGDATEAANTYSAPKYQGVNYGARNIANGISLELLNKERTEGYNFVWDGGFVRLTTDPYVELSLVRKKDINGDDTNEFMAVMEGATPSTYNWQVSFDGTNWNDITGVTGNTYNVPVSLKTKYVKASASGYTTLIEIVEADKDLCNPNITAAENGEKTTFTFNLNQKATDPKATFATTYQWYSTKADADKIVGQTAQTLTLDNTTFESYNNTVWCEAVVKELGVEVGRFFIIYGATVVYVNGNNTIFYRDGSGKLVTDVTGDAVTAVGNDENNGKTPLTPVKTLAKANELLKTVAQGGTVDNNIIVVIGKLNPQGSGVTSANLSRNNYTNRFQSRGKNPATLTGKYEGSDYNGEIIICEYWAGGAEENANNYETDGHNCFVLADTKFEDLIFSGSSSGNNFIECHGNDVTFGKGLILTDFKNLSQSHGNFGGTYPELTIVLTATNLAEADIKKYTTREKPQVVTFQSGHYGRIMGGRYTNKFFAASGNTSHTILGSAANPVWAVVNIDIDKENEMTNQRGGGGSTTYTGDINCVIAGLTDGSMYGDYTINFHGGNVSYIVGGNQGNPVPNGNATYTPEGGTPGAWGQWPNATYFGRTVINVEQDKDCKNIAVGNLYAGGLGREANGDAATSIVDMYYYGHTEVNVKSGTVGHVYAGGAGGVMGVNPWDAHLPYATTADYSKENAIINNVQYGDTRYGTWSSMDKGTSPMAKVTLHNLNDAGEYVTEQLDLANSYTTVNISGGKVNGNVYGGGYGYVDKMPEAVALQGIGSVFGTANINITGGEITGSIYGGSQGATNYFNKVNKYGQTITHIAEMNGTVNMRISGTPSIGGDIYGAGQGIASATVKATQADVNAGKAQNVGDNFVEEYPRIATTGNADLGSQYKSTVNVTIDFPDGHEFNGNIFGGGKLGAVDGNINVVINSGTINGNVYGGGKGEKGHLNKAVVNGTTNVTLGY